MIRPSDSVAVIGDGKLGILIAHVLSERGYSITFLGRHQRKLDLVEGTGIHRVLVSDGTASILEAKFDVVVEASGSPQGIVLALALTRPLGTLVLKSTCSATASDSKMLPQWSVIANDIVVQEKRVVGSRCGPFAPALELLRGEATKKLVNAMVDAEVDVAKAETAILAAQRKGALKVQIIMSAS